MESITEINLIDFFRDEKWSKYYEESHKDKVLNKGHSEFKGSMKKRTLSLLSTFYHQPIKLEGKKEEKRLIIGKKREIQLPNSNHDKRMLRGATKAHEMAVPLFRNYIVKLLNLTRENNVTQQFIDDNLVKSKKQWLAEANIIVLTKEAFSSNLMKDNYLKTVVGKDLAIFSGIYYQKLSASQQAFFNKIQKMLEGQIDFKERYFCNYDSAYPEKVNRCIPRKGKLVRELSKEEYEECIDSYNSIKQQYYYNRIESEERLNQFENQYGFSKMWTEYELDYKKLIDKDYTEYLYTEIKDNIIEENILRKWLWTRYDRLTEIEFRYRHISDRDQRRYLRHTNELAETRFSRRRVYVKYSMEIDKRILLPNYINSIDDIQSSYLKVLYTVQEYKYFQNEIDSYNENIKSQSFLQILDNNYLAKKYKKIIENIES